MGSVEWDRDLAEVYDAMYADQFASDAADAMVEVLAELAGDGPVLELAVGTGRIALPLAAKGVDVHGIELSRHMVQQLRAKRGGGAIPVAVGDMTTARVAGRFSLVYLVANTIMNVTTQDEQLMVFANAAEHLEDGGCFVVEVVVPQLHAIPPGERSRVFTLEPNHVGIETLDDRVGQIAWSHHWMSVDGRLVQHSAPYRYVWPSELDLMARINGFRLRDRWADWQRSTFTESSTTQVAVFEKVSSVDQPVR